MSLPAVNQAAPTTSTATQPYVAYTLSGIATKFNKSP